ncbi:MULTISPECIES: hypothetical protein [Salipiger]|uniref:hypothetical protein n=1 Tax=Salipiger TaxID=263377 RepID=UPI003514BE57
MTLQALKIAPTAGSVAAGAGDAELCKGTASNRKVNSRRSTMSLYAKGAHKRVARMLGFALTLGDEAGWHGFHTVLKARLTREERAALAFAALKSLDEDTAYLTASVALFDVLDGEALA